MKYEYRGEFYDSESEVDEAICEYIGDKYNNIDPMDTVEFEEEWRWEVTEVNFDVATKIVNNFVKHNKKRRIK